MSTSVLTELYRVPVSANANAAFVRQGQGLFHNMTSFWSITATLLMDSDSPDYILAVTQIQLHSLMLATQSELRVVAEYSKLVEELKQALDARKI